MDSPALEYGCQIFPARDNYISKENKKNENYNPIPLKRNSIEVGGIIASDEIWAADTVKVIDNITIADGVSLSINADVKVEFQGFYHIDVKGSLLAVGEPNNFIVFTSADNELFQIDYSETGAWNGIKFHDTSAQNETSVLQYCVFENSKSFDEKGGVFSVYNVSKLKITNCIFQNNLADYGGAVSCEYYSSPLLTGNIFKNNYAFIGGSPFYSSYSYPKLINNTVVENQVLNEDDFYKTAALQTFISKPLLINNIFWENIANYHQALQLIECKGFYCSYNDIQNGHPGANNISANPLFIEDDNFDYALAANSPCINTGLLELPFDIDFPQHDIAGNSRINLPDIDMGAIEWYEINSAAENVVKKENHLYNYPNPFNPVTTIFFMNPDNAKATEVHIYNLKGQLIKILKATSLEKTNTICWNGRDKSGKIAASGIYCYKLLLDNELVAVNRCLLLK